MRSDWRTVCHSNTFRHDRTARLRPRIELDARGVRGRHARIEELLQRAEHAVRHPGPRQRSEPRRQWTEVSAMVEQVVAEQLARRDLD